MDLPPRRGPVKAVAVTERTVQTTLDGSEPRTSRAIEASGVSKHFGGVQALRSASFSADFGEVHALVGENGAGKSTMIKILSAVLAPDEGAVRIKGVDVSLASPLEARRLGVAASTAPASVLTTTRGK